MQLVITHQLPQLQQHLDEIYHKLNGDLSPLLDAIGTVLRDSTHQRFNTKIAPDGVRWANLMPNTVKRKRNNNILVDGGELSRILYQVTAHSVAVGTDTNYGAYHQLGTSRMVARPFLGISNQDEQDINSIINLFLRGVVNNG